MNKQQSIDAKECEEMDNRGESKECGTCSCNVCIAQVDKPTDKEIPKMPVMFKDNPDLKMCRICGLELDGRYVYCPLCGQKINWQ